MTVSSVGSATSSSEGSLGLSFQSLLQIILTQLTYQDPLHPLDNFQFVSQLAQFSELQLDENISTSMTSLLSSQASAQAVGLIGHEVTLTTSASSTSSSANLVSGTVKAVTFSNSTPALTVDTSDGQTLTNIAISQLTEIM